MQHFTVIRDIVIILLVSIPIIYLFRKINIPSIVGFLIAGMVIGPNGFNLISGTEHIEVMAEVGVILLLFTIGLEVSFSRLLKMKRMLLIAGLPQVVLTIIFSGLIFYLFEVNIKRSIFLGMLVSLSSTAIVLKLLSEKNQLESPHGRISIGILIFQDLAVVPMFLLLPVLSASENSSVFDILRQLLFAFAAIGLIIIAAKSLIPKILFQLAKLQMREVFTIGTILFLLGTAYLTHLLGLSFALGAFIAGLILSESDLSHQVTAEILPLKDAFNSIFFVSIGLLLDINFVIRYPAQLAAVAAGIIILKSLIIITVVKFIQYPLRVAVLTGLILSQIGEFSFVLIQAGRNYNLIETDLYNSFLASSIFTMIIAPFLFEITPAIAHKFGRFETIKEPGEKIKKELNDHVVIAGFGLNGRNLARVLKETGINYLVVELNPETIKAEKEKGENIIYGDITREEILFASNIDKANIIVFAISDPSSTKIALRLAKRLNPSVYTVVRTKYINEIDELTALGADSVIPEEFETSLQIFSKVLERYHIPLNIIMRQVAMLRGEAYSLMRTETPGINSFVHLNEILAAGLTETYYVNEDNVHKGKTLRELNLRAKTDTTIIAIVRGDKTISNPTSNEKILSKDTLVVTGNHKSVDAAFEYLDGNLK
ncbi:MAG TPA: cation:proton antiporter [Ignavibacteriaceae bacterium]|nr:cation:proton antiporter [Ignavibacteriaceae bacterium]